MPSDRAVQLAKAINNTAWADCCGNSGIGMSETATLIDAAISEARLEGAKAMQEATINKTLASEVKGETSGASSMASYQTQCIYYAIRALDPQQVINESME